MERVPCSTRPMTSRARQGAEPFLIGRLWLAGYRGIEAEALVLFDAAERAAIRARWEGIVLTFSRARAGRAPQWPRTGRCCAGACSEFRPSGRAAGVGVVVARARGSGGALWRGRPVATPRSSACRRANNERPALDLALGIEARSRALVSEGARAEQLYDEAIDRLGRSRMALELARARSAVWRMAAARGPSPRRSRGAARRAGAVHVDGRRGRYTQRADRELLATGERQLGSAGRRLATS